MKNSYIWPLEGRCMIGFVNGWKEIKHFVGFLSIDRNFLCDMYCEHEDS